MNCYLCLSTNFTERPGSVRDDKTLKIMECQQCGLVRISSQENLQMGHYENSGMHGKEPEPIEVWMQNTAEDDERRFSMLKAQLPNKRLLDFGCGNGGFLQRARELALEIAGIEPERRVQEYWQGRLRICPNLTSLGEGQYDLITAFHVMEHLPDPRKTLQELAGLISPQGRLVIEVPSSSDALLTLYECEAFQHFTYWSQHLYLFNSSTLATLARQAELKLEAILDFQHYPLSNHLYWLSRAKPGGQKIWSFLESPLLKEAYANVLASIGKSNTIIK